MAKKESLSKLIDIIETYEANRTDMMFRNYFILGCILSIDGEERAAEKILKSLFDWLGYDNRKTYFNSIIFTLHEYAEDYAWEISANSEFNELIQARAGRKELA